MFEEFKILKTNIEFKHIKHIPKTKNNKIDYSELEKIYMIKNNLTNIYNLTKSKKIKIY